MHYEGLQEHYYIYTVSSHSQFVCQPCPLHFGLFKCRHFHVKHVQIGRCEEIKTNTLLIDYYLI